MNEQKPNYYALITADVRYDDDLIPNAKLLYGEITALCNKEGYCWATNDYFAELYKTSEKTISRWVKNLESKGYIATSVQTFRYNDGTVKKIRYIFLDKNKLDHMDKSVPHHMDKNVQNQPDENVPYNIKINNNTTNNNTERRSAKRFTPPTLKEVTEYCLERKNNINPQQFVDFYTAKGWKVGNSPMKDWKAAVRTWEQRDAERRKPKDDGRFYKSEPVEDDLPF